MSSCACRRWGPGTVCEKPVDSANARELEGKMKALLAERERQANFWTGGESGCAPYNKKECEKDTRQCDRNVQVNTSNHINRVIIEAQCVNFQQPNETLTNLSSNPSTNQSSSQQMRFWN